MPSVCLALVFYVASYSGFIDANRGDEVAFRPNTVCAPINLFEKWKFGLHAASSVSLDDTHYFADGPLGRNRDQQVDVILVSVDSFELNLRIVLVDGLDSGNDEGLDAIVDDFASVFGRKYKVIVTEENTVGLTAVDGWHQAL